MNETLVMSSDNGYALSMLSASPVNTRVPSPAQLAAALSRQPWQSLGLRSGDNADQEVIEYSTMIDRVVAVLERRIVAVIRSKRPAATRRYLSTDQIALLPSLHQELQDYVGQISSMYRGVHYHSFMHATHVTISLDRMIDTMLDSHNTNIQLPQCQCSLDKSMRCFGLYNDPLAHLCLVFAALVHDVDHTGVCNKDLVKEGNDLAVLYNNLSIAEQHSLAIAFSVLFEPTFEALRDAIFPAAEDYIKFMDIVTELVIHTDLGSPKIKENKTMWSQKFGDNFMSCRDIDCFDEMTKGLVMVMMLQAADVAHNIQGWDNFLLWNHRLYDEMLHSFLEGKGDDPAPSWFQGQISFFDGYIIPLAKKLQQSGAFAASGEMFLNCVLENRRRWVTEGEAVTRDFILTRSYYREASRSNMREDSSMELDSNSNFSTHSQEEFRFMNTTRSMTR